MASASLLPITLTPLQLFIHSHVKTKPIPPPASVDLSGQTAIVTGSNTGIGLETARNLVEHRLTHLIMAVRSIEKGQAAAEPLRRAHPDAKIEVWKLDMLSYPSIQAFAQRCSQLAHLDIAILNAGTHKLEHTMCAATGHEETFQVNYLSTALLAILLLPVLKAKSGPKSPGKLTLISSALALQCKFANRNEDPLIPSFDDPKDWNMARAMEQYSISKLCILMLLKKLAESVDAGDVTINAAEPGFTPFSGLSRDAPIWMKALKLMFAPFLWFASRTERQAAWAEVHAAAVVGQESHGGFVMNWDIYP
jgi:NAD(P)-dependent dehydrogenase (short-subunit alcohol dehydrogenase family)